MEDKKKQKKVHITARLDPTLIEKIISLAKHQGRTVSNCMERLLSLAFDSEKKD
jgi:hypothetical protein